jgi:hypothetical protein
MLHYAMSLLQAAAHEADAVAEPCAEPETDTDTYIPTPEADAEPLQQKRSW